MPISYRLNRFAIGLRACGRHLPAVLVAGLVAATGAVAVEVPFAGHTIDGTFDGAISVYATDVDGDGDTDVLGAAFIDGDITWWENESLHRSAVHPTAHTIDGTFDGARSVFAADVDGDGDTDVLGAASVDDNIMWWENQGGQFSLATTDLAPILASNSEILDLLKIVVTHEGRSGDSPVELASLELRLTDGSGVALTEAQALAQRTVSTTVVCEAGTVLTAGDNFIVVSPGNLTFRAGQRVDLEDGFEIQGGTFEAEIDPGLEP